MAIIGGNLENKEIGLPIDVSGTHSNTQIDTTTGYLTLKQIDTDGSGRPVYVDKGTWISDVIDLQDKFADFGKIFTTSVTNGNSSIAVLTRVSDNGTVWSEWIAVAYDGTIQSDTKQFIQVRIDFFAGFVTDVFLVSEFNNVNDVNLLDNNIFIETSNGLRLKRNYEFNMTIDNSWSEEGSLYRKPITRSDWLKIDKLNVLRKEIV